MNHLEKVCKLIDEMNILKAEIARLKRGDFTPEELQNLCHNLSEEDEKAFCDGCEEYQRKLFGKARADKIDNVLVQDDDGHWYIIKESEKELFEDWVVNYDDKFVRKHVDFTDRMINGPHTLVFGEWRETVD